MNVNELKAVELPVDDDALVFVWTVNQFIAEAYSILDAWGVPHWFTMTWVKNAGPQFPGRPCSNAEFVLVGRKGKPKFRDTKMFQTANYWPRRGHSVKPEEFYDLLRRVTEGPPLDMFNRRAIAGFDTWGDERYEGETAPDHYQTVLCIDHAARSRSIVVKVQDKRFERNSR